MEKLISRIINIIFCFVFGFIILGGLFYRNRVYGSDNQIILILATIIWLVILFMLFKKINGIKDIPKRRVNIILVCFFVIFFIIQLIVANQLKVIPTWDFGNNFFAAQNYVLNGELILDAVYPNNYFLTYSLAILYKISAFIGYMDFQTLSVIVNIILIDLSIFIIYLTVKKLLGVNKALFATFMCLFVSPFLLYTPIFYSDTLSLFVPILMFYIFINISEDNTRLKNILLLICLGIVAYVGYKLKGSTIVFLVAICLIWLFKKGRLKGKVFKILITSIVVIVLTFGYHIIENAIFPNLKNSDHNLPMTHYIMMGLNDENQIYGSYLYSDRINTENATDKVAYNLEIIQERIGDRGILGNIEFYAIKTLDTWTDGTYFAPEKLSRQPVNSSPLHNIVLPDSKYFDYCFNFYTGIVLAMYIFMVISCFIDLKGKINRLDNKTLLRCGLLGLWLFLLIWESRSRYLVDFVPIMIVLTTLSLVDVNTLIENSKLIKSKKNNTEKGNNKCITKKGRTKSKNNTKMSSNKIKGKN